MLRSPDPAALPVRLDALGFDRLRTFGPFVVGAHARCDGRPRSRRCRPALRAYRARRPSLSPEIPDFGHLASVYRSARIDAAHRSCARRRRATSPGAGRLRPGRPAAPNSIGSPGHLAQQLLGVQRLAQLPQLAQQSTPAGRCRNQSPPNSPAQPLRQLRLERPGAQVAGAVEAAVDVLEVVAGRVGHAAPPPPAARRSARATAPAARRVQLDLVRQLGGVAADEDSFANAAKRTYSSGARHVQPGRQPARVADQVLEQERPALGHRVVAQQPVLGRQRPAMRGRSAQVPGLVEQRPVVVLAALRQHHQHHTVGHPHRGAEGPRPLARPRGSTSSSTLRWRVEVDAQLAQRRPQRGQRALGRGSRRRTPAPATAAPCPAARPLQRQPTRRPQRVVDLAQVERLGVGQERARSGRPARPGGSRTGR